MFKDRIDAGLQLATALNEYRDNETAVVLSIPRGGVVPGYVIARELNIPLEVIMVKKLGHPENQEYAIGAVSMDGIILNDGKRISKEYIDKEVKKIRDLLCKRYELYHGSEHHVTFAGKTVIIVDDGIATGRTLMASIELVRQQKPAKIVIAVPVGPRVEIDMIRPRVDEFICLETHDTFHAVGMYYRKFDPVTDEEVIRLLREINNKVAASR